MKNVKVDAWDEEHITYIVTDFNGSKYGVCDVLDENGHVADTIVMDFVTCDEIMDSELWKRIIIARAEHAVTLEELLAEDSQ